MLRVYDTLSRGLSPIQPVEPSRVGMYTCGPTVYRDAHIGNLRSYLMADWIRRVLEVQGISVRHVKNITDVGHMRQEALERGGDKVIVEALARGMTPQDIASHYTDRFLDQERRLNILPADVYPKATDHVSDMIAIIEALVSNGHAYAVDGNVYYDVSSFGGYGKLSGNTGEQALQEAVRIDPDPLKRDPRDFTLWKLGEPGRDLVWDSPWGKGFPGWHIECSAMSIKYLGERFDIHTGGVDNVFPHHEGEVAQSEGFVGERVVTTWVHGQHLLADGVKMAKSAGNSFTLSDIDALGIDPLALRYLCMTARYNTRLNFTFTSLKAAQRGLLKLQNRVWEWGRLAGGEAADEGALRDWRMGFLERVNDNLDMPGALAMTWSLAHSDLDQRTKLEGILGFDRVLGLGLAGVASRYRVSNEIVQAVEHRAGHRRRSEYDGADVHREEIAAQGFELRDEANATAARPKTSWEMREETWRSVSSSAEVASWIDEPDEVDFTVGMVAGDYVDDVRRCLGSAFGVAEGVRVEVVVVDNGSPDEVSGWLEQEARREPRLRVVHTDHVLGEGAARNIVLRSSRGRVVVLLDTSVEVTGDLFGPIAAMLDDPSVGVAGPFGLRSADLRHFHEWEGEAAEMDAMQAYCFAFRRSCLRDVGLMRESFRFYRNLDIDYSFHFRDKGYRIVADPRLPVRLHEHRAWSALSEEEREESSRRNFTRFLDKWGDRLDLVVSGAGEA